MPIGGMRILHSRVNGGDRVRTVERSRAEIDLGDDNLIRLAPLTTLDLRKLQEEQADLHADRADTQTGHTSDIFIEEGEIWAELNGLEEADQFEISSGLVGAAITGTGLRIRQDQRTGALVRVYHGEVQVGGKSGGVEDRANPCALRSWDHACNRRQTLRHHTPWPDRFRSRDRTRSVWKIGLSLWAPCSR